MRTISNLLGMLIVLALVVGAAIFVSWIIMSVLGLYRTTTTVSVVGGSAFIDPSDSRTVAGEVVLSIIGSEKVTINSINVVYNGNMYTATCFDCATAVSSSYPNSANDLVYINFYFRANSAVSVGDKFQVIVTYTVGQETRQASGVLEITE
jgi:hypothetical protein